MRDALTGLPDEEEKALAEPDDIRILDDSPLTSQPYRVGDVFDLYESGTGVKWKVCEIVERDGRRITYGTPA